MVALLNLLFSTNVDFANASNPEDFNFLFAFFLICQVLGFAYFLYRFLFSEILLQAVTSLVRLVCHALFRHHFDLSYI